MSGHWIMPVQDDGMSDPIYYQVRCSECGFDLDPQTWHQELHQYGADKFCPKCGSKMYEDNKTDLSTIEDDICKELKLLRKSKRITQEAMGIYLAKQIGKDKPINKAQIYNYECGKNRITFPIFVGWCKVCGANPGEVLSRVVGKE